MNISRYSPGIIPGLNRTRFDVQYDLVSIADYCAAHPQGSNSICQKGLYGYTLNFEANIAFAVLYFALFIVYFVCLMKRRERGFNSAMMLGVTCEILGYIARSRSQQHQFDDDAFLAQICCLTIGPAFMAAGMYLCLRRIVYCFGQDNSIIRPESYIRIFIPCDIISLIIQAVGGGLASHAYKHSKSVKIGDDVMIAGLAFQVFTMFLFIIASSDFAIRVYRRSRAQGDHAFDQSESVASVRNSRLFKFFLGALAFSTVCIFIRCVFRVAELSGGWKGPLMQNQTLFIIFESTMVLLAATALAVFNPSFCLQHTVIDRRRFRMRKF